MYSRTFKPPATAKSFFLFGPRATGKTTWLKSEFGSAIYLDLLESNPYTELLARPGRLETYLPRPGGPVTVIIDEVQRVPALLSEVHRLIEARSTRFVLTGSSARKLKKHDVNLLAGRALTYRLYPLTAKELGNDFQLERSLQWGHLPATFSEADPKRYLESYVATYLREEIQQEGLTRRLGSFSRFLEAVSFSQGQPMNVSAIARDTAVHRKVVDGYVTILEDLLLADRVPAFTKRAKRRVFTHPKLYLFDVGVYRAIRPRGPLDAPEEIGGIALETLVYQEIIAMNAYLELGYALSYWRTPTKLEVDFVLYGPRGIVAIEVKRAKTVQPAHLRGLRAFADEYPEATLYLLYTGSHRLQEGAIAVIPVEDFLRRMDSYV